jgi:hypothetical protein
MKFDLNDLRKLVKEEMNRRAVLKEGLYGGSGSTGLEVMPPEVTKNLPNPNSKAGRERQLQQMAKPDLSQFAIELAKQINAEGDEKENTVRFKVRKFINKLAYDLAGVDLVFKNLEENVEPSDFSNLLDFLSDTEKRQLFMYIYHQILPMLETNEDLNVLDLVMSKISKLNPKLANDLGDFVRDTDGKPRR